MVPLASVEDRIVGSRQRAVRPRWAAWTAGLFFASAALQLVASLQRWVFARDAWQRADVLIEDHRFDYSYPADPWENLAAMAQLHGLGYLLLAAGVLAMGRTQVRSGPGTRILIAMIAVPFALAGAHALLSGLLGVPSPLQVVALHWVLGLCEFVGLIVLGVRWLPWSPTAAVTCLMLLGATVPGYLFATFTIAPAIAGYASHDTTPWTETIVAGCTAGAAIAMLVLASDAAVRRRNTPVRLAR